MSAERGHTGRPSGPLPTDRPEEGTREEDRVIDALDEEQAKIEWFPGTRRVMRMISPAFNTRALPEVDLFRLPHRASATYVSQRFVEAVQRANLNGLTFTKVWPR